MVFQNHQVDSIGQNGFDRARQLHVQNLLGYRSAIQPLDFAGGDRFILPRVNLAPAHAGGRSRESHDPNGPR